eukprot:6162-Eustigmatos_ZCMA.PRE.1
MLALARKGYLHADSFSSVTQPGRVEQRRQHHGHLHTRREEAPQLHRRGATRGAQLGRHCRMKHRPSVTLRCSDEIMSSVACISSRRRAVTVSSLFVT